MARAASNPRRSERSADRVRRALAAALPPRRARSSGSTPDSKVTAEVAGKNNQVKGKDAGLLEALNEEMNRRLDRQWDAITQLDTKAGLLVTFEVAAAGLLFAQDVGVGVYVALGGFAVALLLTLTCLAVRSWSNAPRPDVLLALEDADPALAYDRLIRAKAMAELTNQSGLERKADWLKITTWWLVVPVAATAASLLC